ncbi:MAG: alkaline phosphatase family protein [Anaerolineae bacterium]|nr:alkaline phosphatase family protein [Anaerolineae bacterium]
MVGTIGKGSGDGRAWTRWAVVLVVSLLLTAAMASCAGSWDAALVRADGEIVVIDRGMLKSLVAPDEEEAESVPLEHVLWNAGYQVIDKVIVVDDKGTRHEIEWGADVAVDATWALDGEVTIGGKTVAPAQVEVVPAEVTGSIEASIVDVAPTAASALGLAAPAQATGNLLAAGTAEHVMLVFLDGFGYVRYLDALEQGVIPNLAALGEPLSGVTVYPPCTSVGSAAVLTGALPAVNGVAWRGIRKTEVETLFDVATAAGMQVVAVEGNALAFNLRNAEMTLSGDRDGNGSTDDNVWQNALAVLDAGMPDLFWVHFHGIDDAGHTYGPRTAEEEAAIHGVDAAVGELLAALPAGTMTIIFADHGMHTVEEEGRLGNHGHLIEEDMLIPIWIVRK